MAIKIVAQSPTIPKLTYTSETAASYTAGSLMYRDTSTGTVKEATSSAGTTVNIEGISNRTFTSAASAATVELFPIWGSQTLVIADCTASTATNQLNKAHAMTDARTVNNTSSTVATTLGIFIALGLVGAATDKKLLGYFVKVGQVTA